MSSTMPLPSHRAQELRHLERPSGSLHRLCALPQCPHWQFLHLVDPDMREHLPAPLRFPVKIRRATEAGGQDTPTMAEQAAVLFPRLAHLRQAPRMLLREPGGSVGGVILMAATEAMAAVQVALPRASITGGIVTAAVTAGTPSDTWQIPSRSNHSQNPAHSNNGALISFRRSIVH